MKGLCPRPDEESYVRTITYNDTKIQIGIEETQPEDDTRNPTFSQRQAKKVAEHIESATNPEAQTQPKKRSSRIRRSDFRCLVDRLGRLESECKGLHACQVELKDAYQTGYVELKAGQNLIQEQLVSILNTLQNMSTPAATPPPDPSGDIEDNFDVYPDGYYPDGEGDSCTPADAPNTAIDDPCTPADSQSQGDLLALEGPPSGIKFGKRKRKKPTWFKDYTEMKKKLKNVPFDPLSPPDDRLLDSFRRWLCGAIPNDRYRDVQIGEYGPSWFLTLLTPQNWLHDSVSKFIIIY